MKRSLRLAGAHPGGELRATRLGIELLHVPIRAPEPLPQFLRQLEAVLNTQLEADALHVGHAARVAFALFRSDVQRVGRCATLVSLNTTSKIRNPKPKTETARMCCAVSKASTCWSR